MPSLCIQNVEVLFHLLERSSQKSAVSRSQSLGHPKKGRIVDQCPRINKQTDTAENNGFWRTCSCPFKYLCHPAHHRGTDLSVFPPERLPEALMLAPRAWVMLPGAWCRAVKGCSQQIHPSLSVFFQMTASRTDPLNSKFNWGILVEVRTLEEEDYFSCVKNRWAKCDDYLARTRKKNSICWQSYLNTCFLSIKAVTCLWPLVQQKIAYISYW